jgi:hypothetical protein
VYELLRKTPISDNFSILMCFYIKPHEFTPTPIKPTDSNLSKERMTDNSCGNSVIAEITT